MITKVSYARLRNLGNYENERFEAEAEVVDGNNRSRAACVRRGGRGRARKRRLSASAPKSSAVREWRAEQRRRAQSATEEPDF